MFFCAFEKASRSFSTRQAVHAKLMSAADDKIRSEAVK